MNNTYNQVNAAVDALLEAKDYPYVAGFLTMQLVAAIDMMPKTRQKAFLAGLKHMVGDLVTVKVSNCISGQEVELRWDEVGTAVDPSTERYHSM